MKNACRLAVLLTLGCATFGSAFAENASVSTQAPHTDKTPAPAVHKPKVDAHPKKPDLTTDAEKKPAASTIPMDFSYIKRPDDEPQSSKSDFDGALKPDVHNSNGGFSPGMKFNW